MSDANSIHANVKTQFAKTAQAYVTSSIHAKGADLQKMVELAGDVRGRRVLDVATGGGHTALAFARMGANVTASDLTPEMLEAAAAHIEREGFALTYQVSSAEDLPFADASFDIVTCRIAPHHFADPESFVTEVARVLTPGGQFLLIDNITPEDESLAKVVNHIEKVRDPSHVKAYSVKTWIGWLVTAGLEPAYLERFRRHKNYHNWLSYAQAEAVQAELAAWVLALPQKAQEYLHVKKDGEELESLTHEVMLLKSDKLRV